MLVKNPNPASIHLMSLVLRVGCTNGPVVEIQVKIQIWVMLADISSTHLR